MTSVDPTPRLFAAAAALTGTGVLMCRAEPSWDGILIGLLCLGLWALGTLAARLARPARPARTARSARPMVLEAVVVETPRARPELLPAPRPARPPAVARLPEVPLREVPLPEISLPEISLPEVPTHRQRVVQRQRR